MAVTTMQIQPRILTGGGPATVNQYTGVAATGWAAGQLLKLDSSGTISPVVSYDSAADLDTTDLDTLGTDYSAIFIALSDRSATHSGKVAVQRVTEDTVFEGFILSSAALDTVVTPSEANIGVGYDCYQMADGTWFVDSANSTAPVVQVTAIAPNYAPIQNPKADLVWDDDTPTTTVKHSKVQFKFLTALLAVA